MQIKVQNCSSTILMTRWYLMQRQKSTYTSEDLLKPVEAWAAVAASPLFRSKCPKVLRGRISLYLYKWACLEEGWKLFGVSFFAFVNVAFLTPKESCIRERQQRKEAPTEHSRHLYRSMELWQYLLELAVLLSSKSLVSSWNFQAFKSPRQINTQLRCCLLFHTHECIPVSNWESFIRNFKHRHWWPGSTKRFLLKLRCKLHATCDSSVNSLIKYKTISFVLSHSSTNTLSLKVNFTWKDMSLSKILFQVLSPYLQLYLYMHSHRYMCKIL